MAGFVLEVEFLTGVAVAATPYSREETEWPPHPDRLFQALVAAWGRNEPPDEGERRALEWLEALDGGSLLVQAPLAHRREVVTVFVPTNDVKTTGKAGSAAPKELRDAVGVLPAVRPRKERFFPAAVPAGARPVVRYVWRLREDEEQAFAEHRGPLARLAREVTYLGHSHSLVRVVLLDAAETVQEAAGGPDEAGATTALRLPYPGRLAHLCEQYERQQWPRPSLAIKTVAPQPPARLPATVFDTEGAVVLADAGGFVPGLVAFPLVAKRFRDALLKCAPPGTPAPAMLSGHDEAQRPLQGPHMAIVPLADVGWSYSQGRLMGLVLVWPRGASEAERRAALQILGQFLRLQEGGRTGVLHFGSKGSWSLALEPAAERVSLRFQRYTRPARRWGTVLPAVLDRHPKNRDGQELGDLIAGACLNVGLPPELVEGLEVEVHRHSPVRGAPSVPEVRAALAADSPYRTRPMVHLVLDFSQPIRGPLILGAGRYRGLGLCLPLDGGTEG